MEGTYHIKPTIKSVRFPKGKIEIHLADGRILIAPVSYYPSIKKIAASKRSKITIADGEVIIFHHGDEVYHIRDFISYEQPVMIQRLKKAS